MLLNLYLLFFKIQIRILFPSVLSILLTRLNYFRKESLFCEKNYKMKRTLSIKQFISELGEDFTEHMKKRIMDLWPRCVLTRDKDRYILDLKHVEHTKHDCAKGTGKTKKEYAYGQLIINEGKLYFSEECIEMIRL